MPGLNAHETISSPVSVSEPELGPELEPEQAPEQALVSRQASVEAEELPVSSHNRKKQKRQQ